MQKVKRGDVIFVERRFYKHFAVYIGHHKVIHYAPEQEGTEAIIHEADMDEFLDGAEEFYICNFKEEYGERDIQKAEPIHSMAGCIAMPPFPQIGIIDLIRSFRKWFRSQSYHLYSPEETIDRAFSRLGENKYNVLFKNCEHFAVWCKTGLEESEQVDAFVDTVVEIAELPCKMLDPRHNPMIESCVKMV